MGASLSERVILPFDVWFYGIAQTANCKHLAALCQCVFDYADYAIEIIYIRLYIYIYVRKPLSMVGKCFGVMHGGI